jgi:hypothetical protein
MYEPKLRPSVICNQNFVEAIYLLRLLPDLKKNRPRFDAIQLKHAKKRNATLFLCRLGIPDIRLTLDLRNDPSIWLQMQRIKHRKSEIPNPWISQSNN